MARISANKIRQMIWKPGSGSVEGVTLDYLELYNEDGTPADLAPGADGKSFTFKGDWDAEAVYAEQDVVKDVDDGNLWIATAPVGPSPVAPHDASTATWGLFLEKGQDGADGTGGGGGGEFIESGLKVIRGVVGTDQSIIEGTGFTVVDYTSTSGRCQVHFTDAFSDVPAVIMQGHHIGNEAVVAFNPYDPDVNGFVVYMLKLVSGVFTEGAGDGHFSFTAIGPA